MTDSKLKKTADEAAITITAMIYVAIVFFLGAIGGCTVSLVGYYVADEFFPQVFKFFGCGGASCIVNSFLLTGLIGAFVGGIVALIAASRTSD